MSHAPLSPPDVSLGAPGDVDDAIERVTAMSGGDYWFMITAGRQDGEDWWTRDQAVTGIRRLMGAFPGGVGRALRAVPGQLLLEAWTWTLLAPTTAALLDSGVVLDLAAPGVQIQAPPGARPNLLAIDTAAAWAQAPRRVDPDDPAGVDLLLGSLIGHLAPLVSELAGRTGRSRAALWRGARDRLAGTLLWAGSATGRRTVSEHMVLRAFAPGRRRGPAPRLVWPGGVEQPPALPAPGAIPSGLQNDDGEATLLRAGCCLWWRAGNDPCEGCPLPEPPRNTFAGRRP